MSPRAGENKNPSAVNTSIDETLFEHNIQYSKNRQGRNTLDHLDHERHDIE
jgi:hypothetical protein